MKKICSLVFILIIWFSWQNISHAALLGSYSGKVVDAETGQPLRGASVFIYWTRFVSLYFEGHSELAAAKLLYTDGEGRYRFPAMLKLLNFLDPLDSINIIVYQPGYEAYLKRINLGPYSKPDPEFKEEDNIIQLHSIPPDFDYGKQYDALERAFWGIGDWYFFRQKRSWDSKYDSLVTKAYMDKNELLRRAEWEEMRFREDLEK